MKTAHFLKSDLTVSQNLAVGDLSYTTSIGRKFKLEEIIVHADLAITETITITRDSKQGASYDHVLAKRSLVAEQDFIFRPTGECNFLDGDEIIVACTNANTTGEIFVTIKTSEM